MVLLPKRSFSKCIVINARSLAKRQAASALGVELSTWEIDICFGTNGRKPTRSQKVLDISLTNCPHLWNHPRVFEGIVKSDHLAVVITPRVAVKPEAK